MELNFVRRGSGKPLLLLHDLGSSWKSWNPILPSLTDERDILVPDLPGFGRSKPLPSEPSLHAYSQAMVHFLESQDIAECDAVGCGLGAAILLELAGRRAPQVGSVVALNPGGFWRGWQGTAFQRVMQMVRLSSKALHGAMPFLSRHAAGRAACMSHISPYAWRLSPETVLDEMRDWAASPTFEPALRGYVHGQPLHGAPPHAMRHPVVIGWGRRDRLRFAGESDRASIYFPDAKVHWFEQGGRYPHWDAPQEVVRLILGTTRRRALLPVAGIES